MSTLLNRSNHLQINKSSISKSQLMKLQKNVYANLNIRDVWDESVDTFFWSNNNFLATYISRLIFKIIEQYDRRVNIIELGSGVGKFSFLFLNQLFQNLNTKELERLKYIMTDISLENIRFWKSHPRMKKFIDSGVLEFSLFDICNPKDSLLESGNSLELIIKDNCNILISNFTLCDLPHDRFKIENDQLFECLCEIDDDLEALPVEHYLEILRNLVLRFKFNNVAPKYYKDDGVNMILKNYLAEFQQATFNIPVDVINTFNYFNNISSEVYWIINDEAHLSAEHFKNRKLSPYKIHTGLVSNQVNLNALNQYVEKFHYEIKSKDVPDEWFDTYLMLPQNKEIKHNIEAHMNGFNTNDFIYLYNTLKLNKRIRSKTLFALMKLSEFDPEIIRTFRKKLLELAGRKSIFYRKTLKAYILKCWENYYYTGESFDMGYMVGRLLRRLNEFQAAIGCFKFSLVNYGESPKTYFYLGSCYQSILQYDEAIPYFEKSLSLRANYRRALLAKEKCYQERLR